MKNKLTIFAIITLISFNVLFAQVPAVPVASAATSIAATSFTANWASGGGAAETAYYLDVSTSSVFASFVSGYNNLNVGLATSYSVTGLTAGPTYYYRVRGYNPSGSSASSSTITVAGIPVATAATAVTNAGFTANWNVVTGAVTYTLTVPTAPGSPYTLIAGTSQVVAGLTAGTAYTYTVQAVSGSTSSASNTINVTTIPADPVIAAATDIAGTSFSANWVASPGATGYYLDVAIDVGFVTLVSGFSNLALGAVTTYSVTGLSASTAYWYRVRAFTSGGTSGNSGSTAVTTGPLANAATLITQTSFQANWAVAAGSHFLQVSTSPAFGSFVGAFTGAVDLGAVGSTPVAGLTAGTTYYYRYSILAATSPYSNTITVLTVPPNPVSAAATNIAGTTFSANWAASLSATGYYLDVATDALFTAFVTGFNNLALGAVTTYSVTGLTISTAYYYRVRAFNTSGTSGNSGTQNPTTGPAAPTLTAPAQYAVGVSVLPSLTWAGVGTSYEMEISTSATFASPIAISPAYASPAVSHTFSYVTTASTVLTNGTTYYWRVRQTVAGITSDWASREFVAVGAGKPTLNPITPGTTSAFIAWYPVPYSSGLQYDLLWVATNANMSGYTTVAGLTNTYYTLTGLVQSTNYYVQVRAKNTAGTIIISYSTVSGPFTAAAPPIPIPSYPTDPIVDGPYYANPPTLFWYIEGNEPALTYELEVVLSSGAFAYTGATPVGTPTVTSLKTFKTLAASLTAGSTYKWQVRSVSGAVASAWSTVSATFTMYTNVATSVIVPTPSWPIGNPTVYMNPPTLYWYLGSDKTGLYYQIQYADDNLFTVNPVTYPANGAWTTDLFKTLPTTLIPGQKYYWRVRSSLVNNDAGASAWSGVSAGSTEASFTIASTASGAATTPIPSWPVGGAIVEGPMAGITLSWTAYSTLALDFKVRMATSSSVSGSGELNHGSAVEGTYVPTTTSANAASVFGTLTAGATYYWQVRSRLTATPAVFSPWSMVVSFSTAAGSSSVVPLVISPNYLQPISNTSAILTWNIPVPTDTHLKYDLQYSKNENFSNAVTKTNINEPVMKVTGLETNSTYYWRVLSKTNNGSVSSYSSVGSFKTGGITDVSNEQVIPTAFELSQNYPNPFNPTTRIAYSLPQNSYVSIKVYDMLGREVRTLVNSEMLEGNHSVDWNGENNSGFKVSSGTYIYRITAGSFVAVKKMVLIK